MQLRPILFNVYLTNKNVIKTKIKQSEVAFICKVEPTVRMNDIAKKKMFIPPKLKKTQVPHSYKNALAIKIFFREIIEALN